MGQPGQRVAPRVPREPRPRRTTTPIMWGWGMKGAFCPPGWATCCGGVGRDSAWKGRSSLPSPPGVRAGRPGAAAWRPFWATKGPPTLHPPGWRPKAVWRRIGVTSGAGRRKRAKGLLGWAGGRRSWGGGGQTVVSACHVFPTGENLPSSLPPSFPPFFPSFFPSLPPSLPPFHGLFSDLDS